jgi:hypothetical protein
LNDSVDAAHKEFMKFYKEAGLESNIGSSGKNNLNPMLFNKF